MKLIKNTLVFLLFSVAIVIATSYVIAHYYEDEVKAIIIHKLDANLNTELKVDDIELTLIKNFPNLSLNFTNALLLDARVQVGKKDTLLFCKNLFFELDIIELFKKNYEVKVIDAVNGKLRIHIDKEGFDNYTVFQKTNEESSFLIGLSKVKLTDMSVLYINDLNNDFIQIETKESFLKGNFSEIEYQLDLYGDLFLNEVSLKNQSYIKSKSLSIDAGMKINTKQQLYSFYRGELNFGKGLNFSLEGSITNLEKWSELDIRIKGQEMSVRKVISEIPEIYSRPIKKFSPSGTLSGSINIKGKASKIFTPTLTSSFSVIEGSLENSNSKVAINQISFSGTYTNGNTQTATSSSLVLDNLHCYLKTNPIKGNLKLSNFNYPLITFDCTTTVNLEDVHNFIENDTIASINGSATIDLKFNGRIKDLSNPTSNELIKATTTGDIILSNTDLQIKHDNLAYKDLNGKIRFEKGNIYVDDFKGKYGSTNFQFNGSFANGLPFLLLPDEQLYVNANLVSDHIYLDELVNSNEEATTDTAYQLMLPQNVDFNLIAQLGEITFRKFSATDLTGEIKLNSSGISITNTKFNAFDGTLNGDLLLKSKVKSNLVKASLLAEEININSLFYQMEDFDQQFITNNHLKGKTDATITFTGQMDNSLTFNPESINSAIDISIDKGELIGFSPLIEIANYIKSNKLASMLINHEELKRNLEHVKFNTLSNNLLIKDNTIFIPKMAVNSTALDITIEGTQSFDDKIDYKFTLYLSDLFKKEKNGKKTPVIISMTGTTSAPLFSYNKGVLKESVKLNIDEEKQELKSALKAEFGLFESDTTLKSTYKTPEKLDYSVEWEETEKPKEESVKTKPKEKGIRGLFNKGEDKTNTKDFDFEEDDF